MDPVQPAYRVPLQPDAHPDIFSDPSRDGGLSLTFWIYPSGIIQALIFSAINLLLFILTPFVVPLIVLEKKTLREAVVGSFTLMKKNWDEAAACALFLGVVACGVFLTYLLVQAASGMATTRQRLSRYARKIHGLLLLSCMIVHCSVLRL